MTMSKLFFSVPSFFWVTFAVLPSLSAAAFTTSCRPSIILPSFQSTHCSMIHHPTTMTRYDSCRVILQSLQSHNHDPEEEQEKKNMEELLSQWEPRQVAQVGNLCADDEWMGLSMELTELVRVAILEDVKKNAREFLGKEDYKVGDFSKEIDARVKEEVAKLRGKEEYELGDLTLALDELSKDMTCKLTGKSSYETGDLSKEIDKRIKNAVANFCGKDTYEFGDLTREVNQRVQTRLVEFIGKDNYEFGDISKEVERRRREWVSTFLGKEAAENYRFGDITKKALTSITGKEEYEFGDVTKKLLGDLFGKRKRGGGPEK